MEKVSLDETDDEIEGVMENTPSSIKNFILTVLGGGFLIAIVAAGTFLSLNFTRVASGVVAYGTPIGGFTREEARSFFVHIAKQELAKTAIVLTCGEKKWEIPPAAIDLTAQTGKAANDAMAVGHEKVFWQNLMDQYRCAREGAVISMTATFDSDKLNKILSDIAAELYVEPVRSYVTLAGDGSIHKKSGVVGKTLNTTAVAESLAPGLTTLALPCNLELALDDRLASVSDADIVNINSVLASYSTNYYPGDRGDNIALAAGHLDDVLVRSGESFSFNNTVGPRTGSAGYKKAGVIVEGRLEDDFGGGVCQVSSTLYNAILLAGLTPTVRTAHYAPSTYCPPGRDATVADGLLDFEFYNGMPHNVYLLTGAYDGVLTVYVLGTKSDLNGNDIYLETEGGSMQPSVYRVYARDGRVIEREYLHTDYYENLTTDQR